MHEYGLAKSKAIRVTELEARGGIEPPIRVLQTHALPLGYRARRVNAVGLAVGHLSRRDRGTISDCIL
jgi:hypothetical protein